jgi:O-methyltransferase
MQFPPFDAEINELIREHRDYTRLAMFATALHRLRQESIDGSLAEVGVFRGDTSVLLNRLAPDRTLHLFDTFNGFPSEDLIGASAEDAERFSDTSSESVRERLPADARVRLHPGRVPATLSAVSDEKFAFVLIDLDLHAPTIGALNFFYPRLVSGAFLFLHDYNSPESAWACMRAMDGFISDKPEQLTDVCDRFGSVVFRKQ